MADIWVDGVDMSTLGFSGTGLDGTLSTIPIEWDSVPVYDRPGAVVAPKLRYAPKTFSIKGLLQGSTVADSRLKLRDIYDLCGNGAPVTVRVADQTDLRIQARLRKGNAKPIEPALVVPWLEVGLDFEAVDSPFWEDNSVQNETVTASDHAMPTGNADGGYVMTITNCTNPVLTHKNQAGTTIRTTTLTVTVSGADVVTLDTDNMTITKTVASVTTSIPEVVSGGFPLRLLAQYAIYRTSAWQTLALSSGSGSVSYRRKYL